MMKIILLVLITIKFIIMDIIVITETIKIKTSTIEDNDHWTSIGYIYSRSYLMPFIATSVFFTIISILLTYVSVQYLTHL